MSKKKAKFKSNLKTNLIIQSSPDHDNVVALVDLYNLWFAKKNVELQESSNSKYVSCLSTFLWFLTEQKLLNEKRLVRLHKQLLKSMRGKKHGKK